MLLNIIPPTPDIKNIGDGVDEKAEHLVASVWLIYPFSCSSDMIFAPIGYPEISPKI